MRGSLFLILLATLAEASNDGRYAFLQSIPTGSTVYAGVWDRQEKNWLLNGGKYLPVPPAGLPYAPGDQTPARVEYDRLVKLYQSPDTVVPDPLTFSSVSDSESDFTGWVGEAVDPNRASPKVFAITRNAEQPPTGVGVDLTPADFQMPVTDWFDLGRDSEVSNGTVYQVRGVHIGYGEGALLLDMPHDFVNDASRTYLKQVSTPGGAALVGKWVCAEPYGCGRSVRYRQGEGQMLYYSVSWRLAEKQDTPVPFERAPLPAPPMSPRRPYRPH